MERHGTLVMERSWEEGRVMGALIFLGIVAVSGIALDVWLVRKAMR